nr:MAG TPA: hypothetical protein [Caudoviricetes sp.]
MSFSSPCLILYLQALQRRVHKKGTFIWIN